MSATDPTPLSVFFGVLKRRGGISYKETASMILSGRPLSDGRSPASRVNDRSWVSRFVVHAPVGSLQESYFSDMSVAAMRIVSRLKAKRGRSLSSEQILDLIVGSEGAAMEEALTASHQDVTVYRNVLQRVASEKGFSMDERAEIAMVCFLVAACTADVRKAAATALDFSRSVHGVGMETPLVTPSSRESMLRSVESGKEPTLVLMRMEGNYVVGRPHWLPRDGEGVEVGALALEDGSVNNVEADVSARHARIWRDGDGRWMVQGLGSRNGTVLVSGLDHSRIVVEPPKPERPSGYLAKPVELHPGDELILGAATRFAIVEGLA